MFSSNNQDHHQTNNNNNNNSNNTNVTHYPPTHSSISYFNKRYPSSMTSLQNSNNDLFSSSLIQSHSEISHASKNQPKPPNSQITLPTSIDEFSTNILSAQKYDWKIRSRDRPVVELEDRELWNEFYSKTTEMVITKTGRRMFPAFKVRITGLDPSAKYVLLLDIVLSNENRYKYYHNQWIRSGKAELGQQNNHNNSNQGHRGTVPNISLVNGGSQGHSPYIHPDSPSTGEEWMSKPISFHKIKLSNTRVDKDDVIILNSMHKYVPKLYLVRAQNLLHTNYCHWDDFSFEETQFIAVTAYQNDQITKLKINYNPFAKGFRESSSLKKEKRMLPEPFDIPNPFANKSLSPSIMNDFIMLRNKYFKQFSLKNRIFSAPRTMPLFPQLFDCPPPLPIEQSHAIFDNCSNFPQQSQPEHSKQRFKHGFLINDLID